MRVPSLAASPVAVGTRPPRHKVFLPAEMIGVSGTVRVHLLNLSTTGALAYGQPMPEADAIVQLRCGKTSWLARVVWVRDKRFGITHLIPLAATTVAALIDNGAIAARG